MSKYPIIFRPRQRPLITLPLPSLEERIVTANPAENRFFWYYLKPLLGDKIDHNKRFKNYTPDFIYIDPIADLYIDIECDEPYVYDSGEATHYIGIDRQRDRTFTENGWFVLRFAEEQIITSPESCCLILAKLIARYSNNKSVLERFPNTQKIQRIPFWTKAEAEEMAREKQRDRYLNQTDFNEEIEAVSKLTLLNTVEGFINTETDSQIQETKQIWRKPLAERVEDGYAIPDLKIVDYTGNKITLSYSIENLSKFSVGSYLRLSLNQPFDSSNSYACVLKEETGNHLILKAGYQTIFSNLDTSRQDWVLDQDTIDVRRYLISVLDELKESPVIQDQVLNILQGKTLPDIPTQNYQQSRDLIGSLNLGLSEKQKEALASSIATQNYYLIQGPPGTGKTRLLAHLAKILASHGKRILVTAFTHTAINNALRTIKEITGYHHVFKVGGEDKTTGLTWEGGEIQNYEYFDNSPYTVENKGLIIGGTCFALRTSRLKGIDFDTVIFDEAGQITLPIALSGMLAGKRYIFIGDHKQMSPVITAKHQISWVKRSIFETLFKHAPGTMLDITYRMNNEINRFPSDYFYEGKLQPSQSASQRRFPLNQQPKRFLKVLDPETPAVFLEMDHQGLKARSHPEAKVIADIITEAVECGISPQEIAVIAPYRAQVRLIRTELKNSKNHPKLTQIQVNTVESMQGQQREMIIVSLTTSDPEHATERAEFYFQLNRLNVAITRAKTKRIVVGSTHLFEANPQREDLQAGVEGFRQFYENSVTIKGESLELNPQPKPEKTMKTIAIYHNKGGVGKTTVAVNLAATFAKRDYRVLLIDLDSQANTTYATGLVKFDDESKDDLEESNILQVLESKEFNSIPEVARKGSYCDPTVDVIPSHISLMKAENELKNSSFSLFVLAKKIQAVKEQYDIVIIDTPPALNLYARIALIAADHLIIPSDLKPFANQGLKNVQELIQEVNNFREMVSLSPLNIIGVLPTKISTFATFVKYTYPKRKDKINQRYDLNVLKSAIFERADLANCSELVVETEEDSIPNPKSVLDYAPNSQSAQEFNQLVDELLNLI